jgi:hypothetical protein
VRYLSPVPDDGRASLSISSLTARQGITAPVEKKGHGFLKRLGVSTAKASESKLKRPDVDSPGRTSMESNCWITLSYVIFATR